MRTIIAGCRKFDDKDALEKVMCFVGSLCSLHYLPWYIQEVVCGEARGADSLGKQWAEQRDIPVKSFFADWKGEGKAAGPKRNERMGDYAECLVVFLDPKKSRGSMHMLNYAKKIGLPCVAYNYTTKSIALYNINL